MSQYRIGELRIYEGEWWFNCQKDDCNGYAVEYSLNEYEDDAKHFLNRFGQYELGDCPLCQKSLEWAGYSGSSPISNGLVSLLSNGHFMATVVILASITESAIQNLLWAALVDRGTERDRANEIADSRIGRRAMIDRIKTLTDLDVRDLPFPTRNLIAHGRGLAAGDGAYRQEVQSQVMKIRAWVAAIAGESRPSNIMPNECERWLLFMNHWSIWLEKHVTAVVDHQ